MRCDGALGPAPIAEQWLLIVAGRGKDHRQGDSGAGVHEP